VFGKLILTRSGTFEITNGTVRYLGYGGYHWTGTAHITRYNAYYPIVDFEKAYPASSYARWDSMAIRCHA